MTDSINTFDAKNSRAGRPRSFDADASLDAAIRVFSHKGYHGASISDLAAEMGLTAGSIYKAFKDKKGILVAALVRYKSVRNLARDKMVGRGANGREKIRWLLQFYADVAHGGEGEKGCLIVSSANELTSIDPMAADTVRRMMFDNESYIRGLVEEGKADGSISAEVNSGGAAKLILCVLQGMRVVGKTGRGEEEMNLVVESALRALN